MMPLVWGGNWRIPRIEILYNELRKPCVEGCDGKWLTMAQQVSIRNDIIQQDFADAVRILLQKGRGKYRNVLLKGPANCGKTFALNPLNVVFTTFTSPATTTFAWMGAVIFLNDFRWSAQIIPWHNLLLHLEGQKGHLPAPKTNFSQDIEFTRDTPIFCTGKEELCLVHGGVLDQTETQMMRPVGRCTHSTRKYPKKSRKLFPHVCVVLQN